VNESRERLVRILRKTLDQVEQDPEIGPDDPAVSELKRTLLQRIANLEARHVAQDSSVPGSFECEAHGGDST
jgi:hypothetical protein